MIAEYRVLVTGSRTWTDRPTLSNALTAEAHEAYYLGLPMVVVHGGADGADMMADAWTVEHRAAPWRWPVSIEVHRVTPAEWREVGKTAGHQRNQRMVDRGANVCLAFLMPCVKPGCTRYRGAPHESHGAANCAARAQNAHIPTRPFGPGGPK